MIKNHILIEVKATGKIIACRLANKRISEEKGRVTVEKIRKKKGGWKTKKDFAKSEVRVLL